jgi:drug/metabolite transporter (DMT)-like permease
MIGVLIVLSPRLSVGADMSETEALGAMLVLGAAVFAALAQVFVRKLVRTESTSAIVFWFSLTACALSLVTLPFGWVVSGRWDAALLILAGLLGGFGQVLLTSSYRHADASVVAPFEYVSIIFALAIGYWVFDEVPTAAMLGGASLVVAAGVLIIWREHKLGLERSRQRKAMTPQG